MTQYLVRRLTLFIPTLLGLSAAIFILLRVLPGDVVAVMLAGPGGEGSFTQEDVARIREQLGLNKSLHVQYVDWLFNMLRGDLGVAMTRGNRPITGELARQFPVTLQLAGLSTVIVFAVAIPIGVLAAVRQDTWLDYVLRGGAIVGLAMPIFFIGMMIILVLSNVFNWIPPVAFVSIWENPGVAIQQLIFPALALGFGSQGLLMRMTRTQLLEVLREDYVRTAQAKGLTQNAVILRHAVRNALLPVVTIAGLQIGGLFSGTVVVETLFNIPGLGRGLVQAMFARDLLMIQAYIMYLALIALVANLVVDIAYAWLDPRIRYE